MDQTALQKRSEFFCDSVWFIQNIHTLTEVVYVKTILK